MFAGPIRSLGAKQVRALSTSVVRVMSSKAKGGLKRMGVRDDFTTAFNSSAMLHGESVAKAYRDESETNVEKQSYSHDGRVVCELILALGRQLVEKESIVWDPSEFLDCENKKGGYLASVELSDELKDNDLYTALFVWSCKRVLHSGGEFLILEPSNKCSEVVAQKWRERLDVCDEHISSREVHRFDLPKHVLDLIEEARENGEEFGYDLYHYYEDKRFVLFSQEALEKVVEWWNGSQEKAATLDVLQRSMLELVSKE